MPGIPSSIGRPISGADQPMKALKNIEFKNRSLYTSTSESIVRLGFVFRSSATSDAGSVCPLES